MYKYTHQQKGKQNIEIGGVTKLVGHARPKLRAYVRQNR